MKCGNIFFLSVFSASALSATIDEKKVIEGFFQYLTFIGHSESQVSVEGVRSFLTDDCRIESNHELLSVGWEEFVLYIKRMQRKYRHVFYEVVEAPIFCAGKIGCRFYANCIETNGTSHRLDAFAVITFDEDKISHWQEIVAENERYFLRPKAKLLTEGYLQVSDLHTLFYATYGNPEGIPVVVLHGGPGEGCSDILTQFFDEKRYHIILFDQRGSKKSTPFACMEQNTPQSSVEDIERLRNHLGIKKWLVFGGSWGSTLAVLYGQAYPEDCLGFVLRGIFLGREKDYLHLLYGMGAFSPKQYRHFLHFVPEEERSDLLLAYYQRIMDPDPTVYMPTAFAFMAFDVSCAYFNPNPVLARATLTDSLSVYCVAKHFFYYSYNRFFLQPEQILLNMDKISHLPAILIHGKYDKITVSENAYTLHKNWTNSTFWLVEEGGHTSLEPAMTSELVRALDCFADLLK